MRFISQDATWENSWVFLYLQSFSWLIPIPCFWTKACFTPINVGLVFSLPTAPQKCGPIYTFLWWRHHIFAHAQYYPFIVPSHKTQNTLTNTQIPTFLFRFRPANIVLILRMRNIRFFGYVYNLFHTFSALFLCFISQFECSLPFHVSIYFYFFVQVALSKAVPNPVTFFPH